MTLVQLRCTNCQAPLDAAEGAAFKCRFCGAVLVHAGAAAVSAAAIEAGVFLEDAGSNKIGVIKAVHDFTDLGLRESMELVESAPCALAPIENTRVAAFRSALITAGARLRA